MSKKKYTYLTLPPLEAVKSIHPPPRINSDSDLTVNSPYSFCLHKSTTVMIKYSKTSESQQPERQFVFSNKFKEDMKYWKKHCLAKYKRIQELIKEIKEKPFEGKGNPKPLTHMYDKGQKVSSREINEEHRLIYVVTADTIDFLQARYHYTKKKKQ